MVPLRTAPREKAELVMLPAHPCISGGGERPRGSRAGGSVGKWGAVAQEGKVVWSGGVWKEGSWEGHELAVVG